MRNKLNNFKLCVYFIRTRSSIWFQTKCFENSIEELVLQKDFLQKENEQLEDKNNDLLEEINVLQNKNTFLENSLNISSSLILSLEKENEALTKKNLE